LKLLEENYGHERIVHIDWHVIQSLSNPAATARAAYYGGIPATPDVFFDGGDHVLGGGQNMYPIYEPIFLAHEAQLSQVLVDSYVVWDDVNDMGFVNVDVEIAPGETLPNPQQCHIRVAVFEDNVSAANQSWDAIGRLMPVEVILTATNSGDTQNVQQSFPIDAGWNVDNLHAIAFVQRDTNKKVIQSDLAVAAYTLDIVQVDSPAASTPVGVPVEYDFQVSYTGALDDDVVVSMDKSALPSGWDAEMVYNSTTYTDDFTISGMSEGQVEDVLLRVLPSGTTGLGSCDVSAAPVSGAAEVQPYTTFNGTTAILYVDDDINQTYETIFEAAITDAGYHALTYDLAANPTPTATYFSGFDVVIWSTAGVQGQTIGTVAQDRLAEFMDNGGAVFITSQGLLNQFGANSFNQNYLGVATFTQDMQALASTGVPGDPIGDGLAFTFSPPFVDFSDVVTPGASSTVWLNGHAGGVALRTDAGTFRSVFMSSPFEGVPAAIDQLVMQRILDWLAPAGAVSADVLPAVHDRLTISTAPNPFRSTTAVRFAIPNASPVSLDVFDVTGRRVTTLVSGNLPAGEHRVEWDGRDRAGNWVASGVYLVRLNASGETQSKDVIYVK